jgi:5-methylcytosine-specific restriction endonuclease McrA
MPRRTRPLPRRSNIKMTMNKLYKRDRGVCYFCGNAVRRMDASKDHIVPKSKGGSNAASNLALMHEYCNKLKGDDMGWGSKR